MDWLDIGLVKSKIFNDFEKSPKKKEVVNDMVSYYTNDTDNKYIYSMTDYLCNEKEKICICNTHAEDFRKIYQGINYRKDDKYISWCKKRNEYILYDNNSAIKCDQSNNIYVFSNIYICISPSLGSQTRHLNHHQNKIGHP